MSKHRMGDRGASESEANRASLADELREAQTRRDKHPAVKHLTKIQEIRRLEALVLTNYVELLNLMDDPSPLLFSLGHRDLLHARMDEIGRKLHSATASSTSLIQHLGKMKPPGPSPWNERIQEFKNQPVVTFLWRLRDYALHHRLPMPVARIQLSGAGEQSFSLTSAVLRREFGRRGGKVPTKVIEYIESCGEGVDLESTVRCYLGEVERFVDGCLETLRDVIPDLDGYSVLASEVVSLHLRDRMDWLAHARDTTVTATHELFCNVLPIGVIEELEALGSLIDRTERAILELSDRWKISAEAADAVRCFLHEESLNLPAPHLKFDLGEMNGRPVIALTAANDYAFGWTISRAGVGDTCLLDHNRYVPPYATVPVFPITQQDWLDRLPHEVKLRPWIELVDVGVIHGLWQTCSYENGTLIIENLDAGMSSRIEVRVMPVDMTEGRDR